MRRQQIIAKSFGHAGDKLDNDDNAMDTVAKAKTNESAKIDSSSLSSSGGKKTIK